MWLEELIDIAESEASCEVYGILKRPDEKYVTERAYDNPKFVEDIVRDVAARLAREFPDTNRQIGAEMYLAEKTVKNYVSSLLHKLGFSRRTEAAVYAAELRRGGGDGRR